MLQPLYDSVDVWNVHPTWCLWHISSGVHLRNWSMRLESPSTVRSGDMIRSCKGLLSLARFPSPLDRWITLYTQHREIDRDVWIHGQHNWMWYPWQIMNSRYCLYWETRWQAISNLVRSYWLTMILFIAFVTGQSKEYCISEWGNKAATTLDV